MARFCHEPLTPTTSMRGRSPSRCRSASSRSSTDKRLRVGACRLLQHRVVGRRLGIQARGGVEPDQLSRCHRRDAGRGHRPGMRRSRARQHRDDDQRQRSHLQGLPQRRPAVMRLSREQHGPADDAERTQADGGNPPGRDARRPLAHVVGQQLAGDERERGDQHEGAVDRPAEQMDARHVLEREGIDGRVAAQRIEQRYRQHAGHQARPAPRPSIRRRRRTTARRW